MADSIPAFLRRVSARRPTARALGALGLLLAALLVSSSLYVLWVGSWTVVSFDQWRIYHDYFSRPFPFDVLAPQNGHRPVLPGLLFLADIYWFGAHNHLLNTMGILCAIALASLWSRLLLRDDALTPVQRSLSIGLVWASVFWLGNNRVLGHGNESLHVFPLLSAFILAWGALNHWAGGHRSEEARGGVLAAIGCSMATFTYGLGMLTWPVVIGGALWLGYSRRVTISLGVLFGGHAAVYVAGLDPREGPSGLSLSEPLGWMIDAATWLGSPAFHMTDHSFFSGTEVVLGGICPTLGVLGILAALGATVSALRQRGNVGASESWGIALSLFAVLSALLVAAARSDYFDSLPQQRVAPRYLPWACAFWAGLLTALGSQVRRLNRGRRLATAGWATAALVIPLALIPSHSGGNLEYTKYRLQHAAVGVALGVEHDRFAERLFRRPKVVYEVAEEFAALDAAMFAWPIADQVDRPFDRLYQQPNGADDLVWSPRLTPIGQDGSTAVSFWSAVPSAPPGFSDVVVVDQRGIIVGGGLIRGAGHRWARSIGLLAAIPPRCIGYITPFEPGTEHSLFAVQPEIGIAAFLGRLPATAASSASGTHLGTRDSP